jgi:plexin A
MGGDIPVQATALITFETHLTAVAATSTSDFTVAFLGTANGHLMKVSDNCPLAYNKLSLLDGPYIYLR